MTWFKVDDGLHGNKKPRKLGRDKLPAIGLWTLCGSWSAQQLSDGFVPDEIVDSLDPKHRYAKRLTDVGLWERAQVDGENGYQFHDWEHFQPTRASIEAEREEWRRKKNEQRRKHRGQTSESPDRSPGDTPEDTMGDTRQDSPEIPGSRPVPSRPSSSYVRGEGPEANARATNPPPPEPPLDHNGLPVVPPPRCPRHLDDPSDPGPCRACKTAREHSDTVAAERRRLESIRASEAARRNADLRRQARDACGICDNDGYVNGQLCNHDPDAPDRAKKARAHWQAALEQRRKDAS